MILFGPWFSYFILTTARRFGNPSHSAPCRPLAQVSGCANIREFLLFLNNVNEVLIIIFFYMFVYNISLFLFFWMLLQFVSQKNTSISALVDLKANQLLLFIATIVLFSIAGVPPFLGFFPKLLILINLLNSNFFFFYIFFFRITLFCPLLLYAKRPIPVLHRQIENQFVFFSVYSALDNFPLVGDFYRYYAYFWYFFFARFASFFLLITRLNATFKRRANKLFSPIFASVKTPCEEEGAKFF
jgi:hypothetical protein